METKTLYTYEPDYAVHPGEYLEEVLDAKEIKKSELADRMGLSAKHLSQIINKQALITSDIALKLERILGVSANIWNNINADYALYRARKEESENLNKVLTWVNNFPVKDLKKLGFLPDTTDKKIIAKSLLYFFQIPDTDMFKDYYQKAFAANFRKSKAFSDNMYHILSWMRAGEILAESLETTSFQKNIFKENLVRIRNLTLKSPEKFEPDMKKLCAESGVALVFLPEFDKTHLSGVTHWISQDKALIIMSLRYKTNDHFWFTFFHEAAHILLHGKKQTFIDEIKINDSDEQEGEANRFARNILIPDNEYKKFKEKGFFDVTDIVQFADNIAIHPGIVVGCLQHDGKIKYSFHNHLKDKFEFKLNADGQE